MLSTFSTFANVLLQDKSPGAESAKTDPPPGHTYEGTQTTAWNSGGGGGGGGGGNRSSELNYTISIHCNYQPVNLPTINTYTCSVLLLVLIPGSGEAPARILW